MPRYPFLVKERYHTEERHARDGSHVLYEGPVCACETEAYAEEIQRLWKTRPDVLFVWIERRED